MNRWINNGNEQYIISIDTTNKDFIELADNLHISVDDSIAIVTNLSKQSLLIKQLNKNAISYYNIYQNKFPEIPESKIYVLLVLDNDAIILNNLDANFLSTFEKIGKDYLFASTKQIEGIKQITDEIKEYFPYPNIWKSPIINGCNRFLNIYISFGYKEEISEIFNEISNVKVVVDDNIGCSNAKSLYFNSLDYKYMDNVDNLNKLFITFINGITTYFIDDNKNYIIRLSEDSPFDDNIAKLLFNKEE